MEEKKGKGKKTKIDEKGKEGKERSKERKMRERRQGREEKDTSLRRKEGRGRLTLKRKRKWK